MKRDILKIDEDLCNGCGLCVPNCHEGALQVIDGKVRLVSELMCDGLGACIGHCPEGAITIENREAEPYNETKVMDQMVSKGKNTIIAHSHSAPGGCPGSRERVIERPEQTNSSTVTSDQPSELKQWPVQMHLLNPNAPYLRDADLLLAADCVAFSMGNFHSRHLKGRSLAIACPKLDQGIDVYVEKLTAMIDIARVNTITVMMMEVPCCGGLLQMVKAALEKASRKVPVKQMIVGIAGNVLKEEWV
ncbi:MAG: 4Fe-4S binding protein [Bacteroidales bacterium]|jgi:NAD-dependent dihydropyrimidine dehydrogenase PreA subunit|nr:4Fe-4S binding protein [Bacteroidales bacterium]